MIAIRNAAIFTALSLAAITSGLPAAEPAELTPRQRAELEKKATQLNFDGIQALNLSELLTRADEPLTYLELAQHIQSRYGGLGRLAPTPLLEGKDQNREVLGLKEHPRRSLIRLLKANDEWKVSAGAIHGLTKGSVLAVYPPAGQKGDKPLGHVRVSEVETTASRVEPCRFKDQPAREDLPNQARCQLAAINYGDMKVKVAVDSADNLGKAIPAADRKRLAGLLAKLASKEGSILAAVAEPAGADWLLRLQDGRLYLVPGSGLPAPGGRKALPPLFGPYPDNEDLPLTLQDRLGRIARVQNLKKLATDPAAELARSGADKSDPAVSVQLHIRLLQSKADNEGQPLTWPAPGVKFFDGDRVQFRVHNPNPFPIDVTLLYIDSGFAITCLYPQGGEVSRVEARTTRRIPAVRTGAKIEALEHLVLIAVKPQKLQQPADFSALEQDSLEKALNVERTRGERARGLATPLGQLLQHSLYGKGTREMARDDVEESTLILCSWHVTPRKRPQ